MENISSIPVENDNHELVGLITYAELIKYYSTHPFEKNKQILIKDIMIKKPLSIKSDMLTKDAINIIRKNNVHSLPVIEGKNILVGIVTEHDFVNVADHFLQEFLNKEKEEE